ncbi:LOW QUALITY PROTEIN: uncharacterized protein [Amphiura filiformis]|uniref:LOW QUALITY PROTEIN: uncharacterized protein n=1 Tax=Amphiura filiformis TaxID=82378 RepID=UPI003B21166E
MHLQDYDCPLPLGMKSGIIGDSQVTASTFGDSKHAPWFARLHNDSLWQPSSGDNAPWIQVSFQQRMIITGIIVQGNGDTANQGSWVKEFYISYTTNETIPMWNYSNYETLPKPTTIQFKANGEPTCSHPVLFQPPIRATMLRIHPLQWRTRVALRLEILGCRDNDCDYALGVASGRIHDSQLTASSRDSNVNHDAHKARLNSYGTPLMYGWMPRISSERDEWLQVDFQQLHIVHNVITQGCGQNKWMENFALQFFDVKNNMLANYSNYRGQVEFPANNDASNMAIISLEPAIKSTIIRIYPRSVNKSMCLAVEFVGCLWKACGNRLGMESRQITHKQINFSHGVVSDDFSNVTKIDAGRLYSPVCWMPDSGSNHWIEVNLNDLYTITGIITQGGFSWNTNEATNMFMWPKSYKVLHTRHTDSWSVYRQIDWIPMEFEAYPDPVTEKRYDFDRPFIARKVRIQPQPSHRDANCLRFELIGCNLQDEGQICGSRAVEYNGYCIASVDHEKPNACHDIFAENSKPLIIHSKDMQNILNTYKEHFEIDYRYQYAIGLKNKIVYNISQEFHWRDSTPLTFENFRIKREATDLSNEAETCVYVDMNDKLSWRTYECEQDMLGRASICQLDIDECVGHTHGCSHFCVNFPGGYHCACPTGYHLDRLDGKHCIKFSECSTDNIQDSCSDLLYCLKTDSITDATNCNEDGNYNLIENNPPKYEEHYPRNYYPGSSDFNPTHLGQQEDELEATTTRPGENSFDYMECNNAMADLRCECMWESKTSGRSSHHKETNKHTGLIQALAFPPLYKTGYWCEFNIRVSDGYFVRFLFHEINLRRRHDSSACVDTFNITDHFGALGSQLRGSFCGNQTDLVITCRSNNVTVRLDIGEYTSDMPPKLGFIATYNTSNCSFSTDECDPACGARKTMTNSSGEFSTVNFPSRGLPFSVCVWNITLPPDKYISLNFPEFNITQDPNTGDCEDYIELLSEATSQLSYGSRLGHVLCGEAPPLILLNTSTVVLSYKTGLDAKSLGFRAIYESRDVPGCGIGSYTGEGIQKCNYDKAAIATVNYPRQYHYKSHYEWHIETRKGTFIELVFHDFDIPSDDVTCMNNYVKVVDDSNKESLKYCDNHSPGKEPIRSSFNRMKVVFRTGTTVFGKGFYAEYKSMTFDLKMEDGITPTMRPRSQCGKGWSYYKNNCYKLKTTSRNIRWTKAERLCDNDDAHLVSVLDTNEMNFLHYMLVNVWHTEENETYLGLTYDIQSRKRRWVDGAPLTYTDWFVVKDENDRLGQSQPDGGALEQCSKYWLRNLHSTNQWHDVPCASPSARQFVCERPLRGRPETKTGISKQSYTACEEGWNILNNKYCVTYMMLTNSSTSGEAYALCPKNSHMRSSKINDVTEQLLFYVKHVWRLHTDIRLLFKMALTTAPKRRRKAIDEGSEGECVSVVHTSEGWVILASFCQDPVDGVVCVSEAEVVSQACSDKQFTCGSGECIQQIYVCDDHQNCNDNSDENNCPVTDDSGCPAGSFLCDSGECIPISNYCNFKPDCIDQSDERRCAYPNCTNEQFMCNDGRCIDRGKQCDLNPDCMDYPGQSSDELNCESAVGGFQCYDGTWLPSYAYCDGIKDCPGNTREDEPATCDDLSRNSTNCDLECLNGACADKKHMCLYDFDPYGFPTGCRDLTHLRYCELFDCPAFTFKCPSSYCIPLKRRCDDVTDCPRGEDEVGCGNYSCPGAYRCHDYNYCVTQSQICDGNRDCILGDDELFCEVSCPKGCSCSGFSFTCEGVVWNRIAAQSLPKDSRKLNLTGLIIPTRRRRSVEAVNQNVTLKQIVFIDLVEFPFLAELDISNLGITILIPGMFLKQGNLYKLILANNQIGVLLADTFLGLNQLAYLDLSGNPLTTIQPGAFHHLEKLPKLDLSRLQINELQANTFNGLSSVEQLWLMDNPMRSIESGAFEGLNVTDELDIRDNKELRNFNMDIFKGLDQLQIIYADKYLFCCLAENAECIAPTDQLSSCEDLLRNRVLRVAIWMLGFSAFIGNMFVIIWRYKSQEREPSKKVQTCLILNLAIADFLMGVYMLIIASADMYFRDVYMIHAENWQASTLCQIAGFLSVLSSESSVFLLTLITTDRFLGVVFPFSRFRLHTKSSRVAAGIVWAIAFLLSLLPVTLQDVFGDRFYGRSSVCLALPLTHERTPGWEYSVIVFLGLNLLLFTIIFICYFLMYMAIKRASRQCTRKRESLEEIKMATKMAIIVGTDFCCWMPIIIMGLLSLSTNVIIPHEMYAWAAVFILPVNSSANPYLYTISTLELKRKRHRSPVSTASTQNVNAWKTEPSRDYSEIEMIKCSTNDKENILYHIQIELQNRRVLPVLSHKCSAFLLSYYLATQCSMFTFKDVDIIDVDLRTALDFLHAHDIAHGKLDERHVIIDKERRGGRLAYLVMHGSPLRPQDVDEGVSHYENNSMELQMIEEEPMLQRDFRQLQELIKRLRDILS